MGVASKRTFLVINIVLLAVCPFIIGLLIFAAYRKRKLYWYKRGWGRFPASLVVSAGLTFGLAWAFSALNPFVSLIIGLIFDYVSAHLNPPGCLFLRKHCFIGLSRNELCRGLRHSPPIRPFPTHPATTFRHPRRSLRLLVDISPCRHDSHRVQTTRRPVLHYVLLFRYDSRVDRKFIGTFPAA